jgi:hypothetical protein
MKLTRSAAALLVLATTGAGAAQAQGGITREQVLGELAEARRMGDIVAPGCGGGTLREQFPQRYSTSYVQGSGSSTARESRVLAIPNSGDSVTRQDTKPARPPGRTATP